MTNIAATTTKKQNFTLAELFLEIPLACLSFLFFQLMKPILAHLYNFYLQRNQQNFIWQPLSTETLKFPFTLPFWMTFGPRLNTHAIIAPVGPLKVEQSVDIDLSIAQSSAQSWTIAVYEFPSYKTITRISSTDPDLDLAATWKNLTLTPGKYILGLRYYDWTENAQFPQVKVDQEEVASAQDIPENINQFYADLRNHKNLFYSWLNYYVFTVLKLQKMLPKSFVKKQFLPVGDSSLVYYYGLIKEQQIISIELDQRLFESNNMYLTLYDRSSFVIEFYQIKAAERYITFLASTDGFYLIRIRQKPSCEKSFLSEWIDIQVIDNS